MAKNTVDQLLIADPPLLFDDLPPRTHGVSPTEGRRIVEFVNQFLDPPLDPAHPQKLLELIGTDAFKARIRDPNGPAPLPDAALGFITDNLLSRQDAFEPSGTLRRSRPGIR